MKKHNIYIAIIILICSVNQVLSVGHFQIQTNMVSILQSNGTMKSEKFIFKLDSQLGDVWRLDKSGSYKLIKSHIPIQEAITHREKLLKEFETIIIPELNMRQAGITNILEILEAEINKASNNTDTNSMIRLTYVPYRWHICPDKFGRPLTFSSKDISAKEAIDIISEITGLEYTVHENFIYFNSRQTPEGFCIPHEYKITPLFLDKLQTSSTTNICKAIKINFGTFAQHYLKESTLGILTCSTEHVRIRRLLYMKGYIEFNNGIFSLVSNREKQKPPALYNNITDEIWDYTAKQGKDGNKSRQSRRSHVRTSLNSGDTTLHPDDPSTV